MITRQLPPPPWSLAPKQVFSKGWPHAFGKWRYCSHNAGKRIPWVKQFVRDLTKLDSHLLIYSMVINKFTCSPCIPFVPFVCIYASSVPIALIVRFADLCSWLCAVVRCLFHLNSLCDACMLSSSIIIRLSYLLPSLWRISTTINNLDCASCDWWLPHRGHCHNYTDSN